MESVLYFITVTSLLAKREISLRTYLYALEKRPAAVCGPKGTIGVGRI